MTLANVNLGDPHVEAHNAERAALNAFELYRNAINVKSLGAVGNDSADDSSVIQSAFDQADDTGAAVFIPPGTYRIAAPLVVHSDIALLGAGWKSCLKAANGLNDFVIKYDSASSVNQPYMRGLMIDGNNTNQTAGGCVLANNPVQGVFDFVHFARPYDVGLHLNGQQGASGVFGHHNRLIHCLFDNGGASAGSGQGLRIQASDENAITACDFETNGGAGSEAYHIKDWSGLNTFADCTFVGGKRGIQLQDVSGSKVRGCTFDGLGGDNIYASGSTISIEGNLFSGIAPGAASDSYKHLILDNGGYCSVLGNIFDSGTQTESVRAALSQFTSSTHNAIVGNVFRQNTRPYGSGGLYDTNGGSAAGTSTLVRSNVGLADAG